MTARDVVRALRNIVTHAVRGAIDWGLGLLLLVEEEAPWLREWPTYEEAEGWRDVGDWLPVLRAYLTYYTGDRARPLEPMPERITDGHLRSWWRAIGFQRDMKTERVPKREAMLTLRRDLKGRSTPETVSGNHLLARAHAAARTPRDWRVAKQWLLLDALALSASREMVYEYASTLALLGHLTCQMLKAVLNYFGQAALVLEKPSAIAQPFFQSAPGWALVPLVVLATAATIIASQAVISGAFSMTKQAVQLGFLPRIPVVHTSTHEIGQVYVPFINVSLYAAVVFLVVFFKSSDNLAAAYGIAVASTMLLTTLLMYFITHCLWNWKPLATAAVIGPLALVDAVFVSSNVSKVLEGGWFPLLAGRRAVHRDDHLAQGPRNGCRPDESRQYAAGGLDSLPVRWRARAAAREWHGRVSRWVVDMAPSAFLHNLKHNGVMHQVNIFLAGTTDNVPHVPDQRKAVVVDLGHGCYAVTVRHGFMEIPNVPAILELAQKQMPNWTYEAADTSFFLARDTIVATGESKSMPLWREKLFAFLARNGAQAAEYYSLPANRVVEMGGQINI